jgi:hypothetical protein
MVVFTYGCVTSVEAGGEAAGVNIGVPTDLRCEVVTYGRVTSVEAGGEAAGVNVGGLAGLRWRLLPAALWPLWTLMGRPQESMLVVWKA